MHSDCYLFGTHSTGRVEFSDWETEISGTSLSSDQMDENPAENSLYLLRFLKYFISNTSKRFLSEEVGKEMLSFFDVHNAASIFHSNSEKTIHPCNPRTRDHSGYTRGKQI